MTIRSSPENIRELLVFLKKDPEFNQKFSGTIGNGQISGYYTIVLGGLAGISLLKLKGNYSLTTGEIKINFRRSNVYYVSMLFPLIALLLSVIEFVDGKSGLDVFIPLGAGLFFVLILNLGFFMEHKEFRYHLKRIVTKLSHFKENVFLMR